MRYRINKCVYIGSIMFVKPKKKLTKTPFPFHQPHFATHEP